MIDRVAAVRDAKHLLEVTGMHGGKPVLLVGAHDDRRLTMQVLAQSSNAAVINLNITLTQALIDTAGTRVDLGAVMAAMDPASPFLLLDRIHVLMLPQLRPHPIDILCRVARRRAVCVSWPGRLEHGRLHYADPDHPEYLDEDAGRTLVLDLSIKDGTSQ